MSGTVIGFRPELFTTSLCEMGERFSALGGWGTGADSRQKY